MFYTDWQGKEFLAVLLGFVFFFPLDFWEAGKNLQIEETVRVK